MLKPAIARRTALLLCALALLALVMSACSQKAGSGPGPSAGPSTGSTESAPPDARWRDEISVVSGSSGVDVVPIENAQAWLQDDALAAYVDPKTHDEFIVDLSRDTLLSFLPGDDVYESPIGLATYDGEPTREEVLSRWDAWIRRNVPGYDTTSMRRIAPRRMAGSGLLEYLIQYDRYERGVRQREWVHLTVDMPLRTWQPESQVSSFAETATLSLTPRSTILEVIDIAREAAELPSARTESAQLIAFGGRVLWHIELNDTSAASEDAGSRGAWVRIDAETNDLVAVGGSLGR